MKKSVALLLILAGVVSLVPVMADSQVDIGITVPMKIGITYQGQNVAKDIPVTLPFPDLMYNYYFELGPLKLGLGARVWTVLIATAAYPIVSAEAELGPILLNANIGGGIFGYLTFLNASGIETGKVFFPELSAAFRVTDWFALGVSVLGIYVPELTQEGMGYTINLLGRFRVK